MIKSLIKVTNEVRVETETDADQFHKELQKEAVKYVSATAQAQYLTSMIDSNFLSEEEIDIVKRARNYKTTSHPKNCDIITYKYALPNKFFEFVQARLAIAVGDSSEMRDYVKKFQLGVSAKSNNPKDMADVIQKMSNNDIMLYKQNSHKFAEELSANNNILQLRKIAEELTYV